MGDTVFANLRGISCKASSGKTIANFPDVCFTPPTAPPTPPGVPLPYPNTGMASDTAGGSKNVKISGKEVMLKNKSYFKKSTGDEAGSAPKKGVVTSQNRGKVYFNSWSFDVKFEGENVVRHLDLTTHNHASTPGNTPPGPQIVNQETPPLDEQAKCTLKPYKEGCDGGKTGHHCVPDHCFKEAGRAGNYFPGAPKHADGLCVCVQGATKSTSKSGGRIKQKDFATAEAFKADLAQHGQIHLSFDALEAALGKKGNPPSSAPLGELEDTAAKVIAEVTGCDEKDLKKQMRDSHEKKGLGPDFKCRADPFGKAKVDPSKMGPSNKPLVDLM